VPMHPLLSDFAHYGATLTIPAAEYTIQVRVDPSGVGRFDPARFAAAETEFHFDATPVSVASGEIVAQVEGALEQYRQGEQAQAAARLQEVFWQFESSEVDRLLKARDYSLYRALEGQWLSLAVLMKRGGAATEVEQQGQEVLRLISQGSERARAKTTVGPLFLNSLIIILREGVEAILILSALAAYLGKTGHQSRVVLLYGGAGVGVLASILLAFTAQGVVASFSGMQEALEGITMLIAVVVLFSVSYWLISKTEAKRWQEFVQQKIESALSTGRYIALGSLAFLVVFREGFETVLFYQALVMSAAREMVGYTPVVAGFMAGCFLLAALFYVLFAYGIKIPIRRFFAITGGLLYLLAFKFAGDGVRELQEAGLISVTPLSFVPETPFLQSWFGVYPVWETFFLQSLLLVLAIGGLLYTFMISQVRPTLPARLHQEGS
jgi:high-affinity iron transporter